MGITNMIVVLLLVVVSLGHAASRSSPHRINPKIDGNNDSIVAQLRGENRIAVNDRSALQSTNIGGGGGGGGGGLSATAKLVPQYVGSIEGPHSAMGGARDRRHHRRHGIPKRKAGPIHNHASSSSSSKVKKSDAKKFNKDRKSKACSPCGEVYVVRDEGETLQTISVRCHAPSIMEDNPHITDYDDLSPGAVLLISSAHGRCYD